MNSRFYIFLPALLISSVAHAQGNKAATLSHLRWETNTINVCWIAPLPNHAALRELVKTSVQATWVKQSGLQVTGWAECQAGEQAVRIAVGPDEWPRANVGKAAYYSDPSMYLNFDIEKKAGFDGCKDRVEQCIRVIAVHEFGHMLGLIHEQDRPDTPDECQRSLSVDQMSLSNRNASDLQMLTRYDASSVMNYCNKAKLLGSSLEDILSSDDIAAIRILFGEPGIVNRPARAVRDGLEHLRQLQHP